MKKRYAQVYFTIFLIGIWGTNLTAQEGGLGSIFSKGVGARQMGLGGAVIAYPKDPTTIFWNPAGMEYLPQKEFSLFYASFLEGTSYNFVGYVHPTLNIGTFGIGVTRIATGGIPKTEFSSEIIGEFGFDQSELYFSYAKLFRDLISLGLNFKIERQVIDDLSDVGFGVDVALMYISDFNNIFLRDLQVGVTIQNGYSPRIKPGDVSDYIPHRILFGLAKPIGFGSDQRPLVLLFSAEQGDLESVQFKGGVEYSYQNAAMLRFGYHSSDGFTFGAGAALKQFQLDYAYGKLVNGEFGAGHRISFSFHFGRTREEMLEMVKARQQMELNRRMAIQREQERKENIRRFLGEGNQLYKEGKYLEAIVKFRQVLELDPGNITADEMIDESNSRISETQQMQLQKAFEQYVADRDKKQLQDEIQKRLEQGNAYLREGNYFLAIGEFQAAIDQLPQDESSLGLKQNIEGLISKAQKELSNQVDTLLREADALAKKNAIADAIQKYNEALFLTKNDQRTKDWITKRIEQLNTKLDALGFYQQGIIAYNDKNWREARINFEKAKQLDPSNPRVIRYLIEVERREKARDMDFTPAVRERFQRALNLYFAGRYQEAIDIYEEILEIQPYNKRIWDSLDRAREELRKQQRK